MSEFGHIVGLDFPLYDKYISTKKRAYENKIAKEEPEDPEEISAPPEPKLKSLSHYSSLIKNMEQTEANPESQSLPTQPPPQNTAPPPKKPSQPHFFSSITSKPSQPHSQHSEPKSKPETETEGNQRSLEQNPQTHEYMKLTHNLNINLKKREEMLSQLTSIDQIITQIHAIPQQSIDIHANSSVFQQCTQLYQDYYHVSNEDVDKKAEFNDNQQMMLLKNIQEFKQIEKQIVIREISYLKKRISQVITNSENKIKAYLSHFGKNEAVQHLTANKDLNLEGIFLIIFYLLL